jgi:hypothetical protein
MRAAVLGLAGLLLLTSLSPAAVLTTEDEIRQAVVGNTISGMEDGKSYTEYYQPDGHIHGLDPEGPYVGEWRIAGRNICVRYFDEDGKGSIGAWDCMGVDVKGSIFAWITDGERYEAHLVPGNPNKL